MMKLNPEYIIQQIGDSIVLVPVGEAAGKFHGIVQMNKTAAFIVSCMKEETTEEAIVEKMASKYDADRETIAADVKEILGTLRRINALEE